MMEDHSTEPFIVGPGSHARERSDGSDIKEHEYETAAGSGKRLVVRGDLLGADSLEQCLHVVIVAERDGVLSSMIWVLIAFLHLRKLVLIVAFAILSLVSSFSPEKLTWNGQRSIA